MTYRTYVADDFNTIREAQQILEDNRMRRCRLKAGGAVKDCWCYMAAPDGKSSLPCPGTPPP